MSVFKFDAEIGRVLNLVINSIYTNKEIFIRELISNASDAINKRKYLALSDSSVSLNEEGQIKIKILRHENALSITDNGIGMNEADLIKNIGTIANSGTFKFIENLKTDSNAGISSENMIGQFGVGFYSAFMVANFVEVKTRKVGTRDVFLWKSEGKDDFTIESISDENFPEGTEIKLFLKPEMMEEFLDKFRLEHVIKTYSNHIEFPISLEHEEGISEKINEAQPLWVKKSSEVTREDYIQFYHSLSYSGDEPFLTLHNKVEGMQEYTNLLFIPTKRPFDLYNPERKTSIKLYVKKVFITEENIRILPEYLRFVKGVIDSSDLPLNISRETLQNSDVLTKIGKSITKKIFAELRKKLTENKEEYKIFWKEFGNVIKEGLCRPEELRDQIMEACLFYSSLKNDYVTLEEYIQDMKPEQENIYYLTADSLEDGIENAGLERFKKNGIEVLILTDTVDDFWVTVATDYKGKEIKNIASSDEKTDELLSKSASVEEDTEEGRRAIEIFKNSLSGLVKEVKISHKLDESPVMLVAGSGGMSIRMEKYLIEQKQLHASSKKILEINLKHEIVQDILSKGETDETKEIIFNLFDLSCIASGEALRSNSDFTKRMFSHLLKK
jgi:molecular chaperone HtpG